MNLWDEIVELKTEDVVKIIEEQFQTIKIKDIYRMANGLDNNVYKVNDRYLFRFPRRGIANKLIKKEGSILPILKQYLSIPVPNPVFYGNPTDYYPFNFMGYDYLRGYCIEEIAVINSEDSITILADFLSQLHSVPINEVERVVGYDDLDRLNIEKRKEILIKNTENIKKMGLYDTFRLESYINDITDITLHDEKVLVHGDLHIRNLLYNNNGVVSSVIDFGDIHIGHIACDLAIVYSIIPCRFRDAFYKIYGDVSQKILDLARFRSIFTSTILLLSAYDSGNIKLTENVILSLNNALS